MTSADGRGDLSSAVAIDDRDGEVGVEEGDLEAEVLHSLQHLAHGELEGPERRAVGVVVGGLHARGSPSAVHPLAGDVPVSGGAGRGL